MRRRALLLSASLLVVCDQALQWTALRDGRVRGTFVAPYAPPLFSPAHVDHLAAMRAGRRTPEEAMHDPELGWCPRPGAGTPRYRYDAHGARCSGRPLAEPREPEVRRVVAVGCSFTHGDEVAGEECWAGLLSDGRADLEVANLGVGGYGVDQALLRWRRDGRPLAPDEVWLGWVPRTSLRATTHLPLLYNHLLPWIVFKPRFAWDGERLALRPNPAPDPARAAALYDDPRALLAALGDDDPWVARARGAYLPRGARWWHASALARLSATAWERRDRAPEPWFADGSRGPARLVREVLLACAREVRDSGARFRLLVLPGRDDLSGAAYWRDTTRAVAEAGFDVLDLSEDLRAAGVGADDAAWMPGGHYAPATQRAVAEAIERALAE